MAEPFVLPMPEEIQRLPVDGDWLSYDHQVPGGVRLAMRNDPLLAPVVGYFYMYGPAHGTEQVHGDPPGQVPEGWILAPGWWYGPYWLRMSKCASDGQGGVVPLTIAGCTFTVGPETDGAEND
jgi:hypothetical protein